MEGVLKRTLRKAADFRSYLFGVCVMMLMLSLVVLRVSAQTEFSEAPGEGGPAYFKTEETEEDPEDREITQEQTASQTSAGEITVTVEVDGEQKKLKVSGGTVGDALTQAGVEFTKQDLIKPSVEQAVRQGDVIQVLRGFYITVRADGEEIRARVTEGTVAEALKTAGITLGKDDQINVSPSRDVKMNDMIIITRREIVTRTEEETLPFEKVVKKTSILPNGTKQIMTPGEDGLQVRTYTQLFVDGELVEEELVSDKLVKEPVTEVSMLGDPSAPVSELDFQLEMDASGEPVSYKSVMRGVKATGYSAGSGARTASGRPATVGNVAVNPSKIPYGTKLYIKSPDGKFVYGYAVAADTGGAVQSGSIAVDLYYSTQAECIKNGVRTVDIFVLE